jgi:hypothetical protein
VVAKRLVSTPRIGSPPVAGTRRAAWDKTAVRPGESLSCARRLETRLTSAASPLAGTREPVTDHAPCWQPP